MQCTRCGNTFQSNGVMTKLQKFYDYWNSTGGYLLTPYGFAFICTDEFEEITLEWTSLQWELYFEPLGIKISSLRDFKKNFDYLQDEHLNNPTLCYVKDDYTQKIEETNRKDVYDVAKIFVYFMQYNRYEVDDEVLDIIYEYYKPYVMNTNALRKMLDRFR